MKLQIYVTVICSLFLFSSCAKEEVNLDSKNYFYGSWEVTQYPVSKVSGIPEPAFTVTFKESGEALFHLPASLPGQNPLTRYWSVNQVENELRFFSPNEDYAIIFKTADQFKLSHKINFSQLTFTRN